MSQRKGQRQVLAVSEVGIAYNKGFSSREQAELIRVVEDRRDEIENARNAFFS